MIPPSAATAFSSSSSFPVCRKIRRPRASPCHHPADVFTVFTEDHVGEARHAGILDVPADYLPVEADRLINIIGDEFVPNKSVCHFAPSFSRDVVIK